MPKQYILIIVLAAAAYICQQILTKSDLTGIPHEKCFIKDSECLKTQVQKHVKEFSEGMPELGIENLDKMLLDAVVIRKDRLIYEISNVTVVGLKDAIIDKFWIDMYVKYIHITFHTTYHLDCDYMTDGYLFSLPVNGVGKAHIVKNHVITEIVLLFDIEKNQDAKDIINLKDYRYGFDQHDATVYRFENLFNGDKVKILIDDLKRVAGSLWNHQGHKLVFCGDPCKKLMSSIGRLLVETTSINTLLYHTCSVTRDYYGGKSPCDRAHDMVNRNWRTTSNSFGRFLFDKINDKIFNGIKIYLTSLPLEDIAIMK